MIRVQNVTKRFDGFTVLDQISVHVPKGAVYGLVGPNGAGKTTLIRHMLGVLRQDEGEIMIGDAPVYENPTVKNRIASIPDELYFFPQASVLEMKRFYKQMYPQFDEARFARLSEIFSFEPKGLMRRFSKGMQKQACFWLTLCLNPEVVILDEPVDGLDPVMRRQVWSALVSDVVDRGTTVLVSSHNLRELEDVCDHVGIMHQGRMLLERSLLELQGGAVKVQVIFEGEDPLWPEGLDILHTSRMGRVHTLIARGQPEHVQKLIQPMNPIFAEAVPLSLEEVFLYELGGVEYAVKEILV